MNTTDQTAAPIPAVGQQVKVRTRLGWYALVEKVTACEDGKTLLSLSDGECHALNWPDQCDIVEDPIEGTVIFRGKSTRARKLASGHVLVDGNCAGGSFFHAGPRTLITFSPVES